MIKIKIQNIDEIVQQEKSWLVSKVAPLVVDVERKVEEAIVKQLEEVFLEKNIIAEIRIEKE
ncbi:MAG: hypothetical protein DWQ05_12635 [Calditrichaeota bacterium]|nr:MAG: hypothetical protein DWQ05_12635 [Calditrichota bacterium]